MAKYNSIIISHFNNKLLALANICYLCIEVKSANFKRQASIAVCTSA
jgi:hypothetical protein